MEILRYYTSASASISSALKGVPRIYTEAKSKYFVVVVVVSKCYFKDPFFVIRRPSAFKWKHFQCHGRLPLHFTGKYV